MGHSGYVFLLRYGGFCVGEISGIHLSDISFFVVITRGLWHHQS